MTNDLTNLLVSIDIPIVMLGEDSRIKRFTPEAARIFKLLPSDIGRSIGDINFDLKSINIEDLVESVIKTTEAQEIETTDKYGHSYRFQIRPYKNSDNKIEGAVIALVDIDRLKRGFNILQTAHDDALLILGEVSLPLFLVDSNKSIKMANRAFCKKFHVREAEIIEKQLSAVCDGSWNLPILLDSVSVVLREGNDVQISSLEQRFVKIGTKILNLNIKKVTLSKDQSSLVMVAIEDLTDRVRIEREVIESDKKYRNLLTAAHDAIIVVNEQSIIEFINPRADALFGYDTGELLGKNYIVLVTPANRISYAKSFEYYLKNPIPKEMGIGNNIVGLKKDGTEFPLDVSLSAIRTKNVLSITCIVRDLSEFKKIDFERKRILEQEKKWRSEAELANRAKDEFLAILSHELRTPLTAILTWAQVLNLGKVDQSKFKQGIGVIEQSAKIQGELIDDLLDVSRIQSGKLALDFKELDPNLPVMAAIDSTRNLALKKEIDIEIVADENLGVILADTHRVQQIFWNLLTNAIKFTPKGGKILIKLSRCGGEYDQQFKAEIRDTGKGISQKFLPHIFEKFSQADSTSTREFGGLGLGLSIVNHLVKMQGGKVSVYSPGEGKGTTFTVSFPLRSLVALLPFSPKEKSLGHESDRPHDLGGMRILIVDDIKEAREAVSIMLREFGADVKEAESADEALKLFAMYRPDILLSDIGMPIEDGYSLIAKIRSLSVADGGKTPAVALTAYASNEDRLRASEAGFSRHLAKPVQAALLTQTLIELMREKNNLPL